MDVVSYEVCVNLLHINRSLIQIPSTQLRNITFRGQAGGTSQKTEKEWSEALGGDPEVERDPGKKEKVVKYY